MCSQLIASFILSIGFELCNLSFSVECGVESDADNQTTNNSTLLSHLFNSVNADWMAKLPLVLWCTSPIALLSLLVLLGLAIRKMFTVVGHNKLALNVIYKPADIDLNYDEQQSGSYSLIDHLESDLCQMESSSSDRQCSKWALPRSEESTRSIAVTEDSFAGWSRPCQSILKCDLCLTDNLSHLIDSHVEFNLQHHHFAYVKKKMVLIEYVGCEKKKFNWTHKNQLSLAELKEIKHCNLTKFVGFLLINENDIKKISENNLDGTMSSNGSIDLENLVDIERARGNMSQKMSSISRDRKSSDDKREYFKRRSLLKATTNWSRCYMIWQYKPSWKSLSEAIHHCDSKLNWPIKVSLINDIIQGMSYLQKSKIVYGHGSLNSRSCIVDQWWKLKITNYGINTWLSNRDQANETTTVMVAEKSRLEKLWMAPEQLRNDKHVNPQASDVYSFALLLYELLTQRLPYDNYLENYTIDEVLSFIANPHKLDEFSLKSSLKLDNCLLIRPQLPQSVVFTSKRQNLVKLITWCWNENPQERPSFNTINQYFQNSIDKNSGLNLIERLIKKLDKHQDGVELQVSKRTAVLEKEKQKSEDLLYRVLPVPVAKSLRTGTYVKPEKFENVTIFFSDIVGFTTIASYSEPFEIISVLNKLFTGFDDILSNYDVFKVETIGDAYMVVSGPSTPSLSTSIFKIV